MATEKPLRGKKESGNELPHSKLANANFANGRPRRAHLVGIGGSGMRALARVLLGKGWRLSGSDLAIGRDDPLMKAGIRCFSGHAAEQVSADVECVIYSSAIPAANPELLPGHANWAFPS